MIGYLILIALLFMFVVQSFSFRIIHTFCCLQKTWISSLQDIQIQDLDGNLKRVAYIDYSALNEPKTHYPMIFLLGTGQTIKAYAPQIQAFRQSQRIVFIETRGQGKTELDSAFATTAQLTVDLDKITTHLFGAESQFNLAGFSFGGRLAIAFAAHYPQKVHKLSITGVPLHRPAQGRLIIKSLEEALKRKNLRECAWSLILNGYSAEMLQKIEKHIDQYVDFIVQSNQVERLYDLIRLSHEIDPNSPFAVHNAINQLSCPVQVIAGKYDRIAGYDASMALAKQISSCEIVEFETGHSIPFEKSTQWCKAVSKFFED
jgi:pimeloyl-ACP methyl ester carboxylesterase